MDILLVQVQNIVLAYQAFYAFNFSHRYMVVVLMNGQLNVTSTNFWIKIQLPVATTIWKFQLTGRFAAGTCLF